MTDIFEHMAQKKIVAAVKIEDEKKAVPVAEAFLEGGLDVVEITFRSDAAPQAIKNIKKECPQILLGAGTITNVQTAEKAVECGASYLIAPGFNPPVAEWCIKNKVPYIPGVCTPSEIEAAMNYGIKIMKFFPMEVMGGIKMLKALSGPYYNVKFIPTGGINTSNAAEYCSQKNVLAVGGSWLSPQDAIAGCQYERITQAVKEALLAVKVD